jgi:hypothetical protein
MFPRNRSVLEQISGGYGMNRSSCSCFGQLDEAPRYREHFESAAHREMFVRAIRDTLPTPGCERSHAKATPDFRLDRGEPFFEEIFCCWRWLGSPCQFRERQSCEQQSKPSPLPLPTEVKR